MWPIRIQLAFSIHEDLSLAISRFHGEPGHCQIWGTLIPILKSLHDGWEKVSKRPFSALICLSVLIQLSLKGSGKVLVNLTVGGDPVRSFSECACNS